MQMVLTLLTHGSLGQPLWLLYRPLPSLVMCGTQRHPQGVRLRPEQLLQQFLQQSTFEGTVQHISWSAQGLLAVITCHPEADGGARLHVVRPDAEIANMSLGSHSWQVPIWSPRGDHLMMAGASSNAACCLVVTSACANILRFDENLPCKRVFNPSGAFVASVGLHGPDQQLAVSVWDSRYGQLISRLPVALAAAQALSFSTEGDKAFVLNGHTAAVLTFVQQPSRPASYCQGWPVFEMHFFWDDT